MRLQRPSGANVVLYLPRFGLFAWDADCASPDNGETVVKPSSTSANASGRWTVKYASASISPSWFGVTGNGIADDRAGLQAAINFAISAGVELAIPAGTYRLATTGTVGYLDIAVAGTVSIRGAGSSSVLKIESAGSATPILGILNNSAGSLSIDSLAFEGPGGMESAYGGPHAIATDPNGLNAALTMLSMTRCTITKLAGGVNARLPCSAYLMTDNTINISGNSVSSDSYRQIFALGVTGTRASSIRVERNVCTYTSGITSLPAEHLLYTYGKADLIVVNDNTVTNLRNGALQLYVFESGDQVPSYGRVEVKRNVIANAPDLGAVFLITAQSGNAHNTCTTLDVQDNVVKCDQHGSFLFNNLQCTSVIIRGNKCTGCQPYPGYEIVQFERPVGETAKTAAVEISGNDFSGFGEPGVTAYGVSFLSSVVSATVAGNDFTTAQNADASCRSMASDSAISGTARYNVGNKGTLFADGSTIIESDNTWN